MMPVYNNLSGQNNNFSNNAWGNGYDAGNTAWGPTMPQPGQNVQQRPMSTDTRIFVNGRAGAEAFSMPQGVHTIELWDSNGGRIYVKSYDNNGFPRVTEDYDLVKHVEPDPPEYATKEDIRAMIEEFFSGHSIPNMNNYVTRSEMNKEISRVASGGNRKGTRNDDA